VQVKVRELSTHLLVGCFKNHIMPGIIIIEVGMNIKHFKETTKRIWFG